MRDDVVLAALLDDVVVVVFTELIVSLDGFACALLGDEWGMRSAAGADAVDDAIVDLVIASSFRLCDSVLLMVLVDMATRSRSVSQ